MKQDYPGIDLILTRILADDGLNASDENRPA